MREPALLLSTSWSAATPLREASAPLLRRLPLAPDELRRLADRVVVRAVDAALDGEIAVVADLLQRAETGTEVEVAAARLQPIAVGDMDVDDALPGRADAGRDIRFLDSHVEEVGHDADLRSDLLGDGHPLLQPVDDVGLVAIERLQKERDTGRARRG